MAEDPANRRLNGGGSQRWIVHLIPMLTPQVVTNAGGPAGFHSDFTSDHGPPRPIGRGQTLARMSGALAVQIEA